MQQAMHERKQATLLAEGQAKLAIEREEQARQERQAAVDKQREMILLTLNESAYNSDLFTGCDECAFCMETFELGQKTTALPCDARHFFHSKCILAWSRNHRTCPLCKVEFDENLIRQFQPKFSKLINAQRYRERNNKN